MARTFGAMLYYGAMNLNLPGTQVGTGAGTANWVRNGLGDVSLNNVAGAATFNIFAQIADFKRPYITFPAYPGQGTVPVSNEFQEIFGTAAGGPSNPFSGGQAGSQFGTPALPWGIAILDIFAVYSLSVANATSVTLGLTRATYTENAAFTNTAVVAATAISAVTTTGAGTPHVQKVALAQPLSYETNDLSDLAIELVLVLPATTTMRVYGIGCHCAVEFS
jgi:hypothetical protein